MTVCPQPAAAVFGYVLKQRTRSLRILSFALVGRRYFTADGTVEDGDSVVLKRPDRPHEKGTFVAALRKGQKVGTRFGKLKHENIIGMKVRDGVFLDGKRVPLRVMRPTLAEYIRLSPRIVTPIYPSDANLIVSLLDINVSPYSGPNLEDVPRLDILEAGTGHGSLTLYLSRAVHAANAPFPKLRSAVEPEAEPASKNDSSSALKSGAKSAPEVEAEFIESETIQAPKPEQPAQDSDVHVEDWKQSRRAVIHTVDTSERHSTHAESIVRGFRNGLYAGSVDFHVGNVADFISEQYNVRGAKEQLFNHIILDLPGVHNYMKAAARALRDDGALLVFAPSVTQIARCVQMVRAHRLPLSYEDVLELGPGYSGGKSWDVRAVKPSKFRPDERTPDHVTEAYYSEAPAEEESPSPRGSVFERLRVLLQRWFGNDRSIKETRVEREEDEWVMVCRPAVGGKIVGGGFVGIWRRKSSWEPQQTSGDEV